MNDLNPAWKPLLDKLPPALHASITPVLLEWDKGVQAKFEEIHKEYEPLKPFQQFVDNNVTPDFAWESVVFADTLQREPAKVAAQINEAFELGFIDKATHEKALASNQNNNEGNEDLFNDDEGNVDLTKIPEFQTMQQTLQQLQAEKEKETQQEQEARELEEFNKELDALEEANKDKPFNRTIVTAFMSQGLDGEEAVKQFHQLLAGNVEIPNNESQQTTNTDAPVTMGNGGNVGSGSGDGSVDWNAMKPSEFNDNVAKTLEAMMNGNQT